MAVLKKVLALAGVVLVLAIALLETVPRFVSVPKLRVADLDPNAEELRNANVVPHPYLGYAGTPNYRSRPGAKSQVSHNSLGFRGRETPWEKPAGTYRIACLGGSSTYGFGPSSDDTNWPVRLEQLLNEARPDKRVEVINAGCRGYSTFEMLGTLAFRVLDFEPDLVIVYETINDVRCALYTTPTHDNIHWRAVWTQTAPSPLERSYVYLIWRRYFTDFVQRQKDLGTYAIVDFDGKDHYDWEPGEDLGFRNIHRNLESIITLAEASGARVVLGKQAFRRGDIDEARTREAQLRGFDTVTEMIETIARERELLLVDGQTPLEEEARRQVEAGAETDDVFTHEVHLTDKGCDMLAQAFKQAILDAGLLDLPPLERERE